MVAEAAGAPAGRAEAAAAPTPRFEAVTKVSDADLKAIGAGIRTVVCDRDSLLLTGSSLPVVKVWQVAEGKLAETQHLPIGDAGESEAGARCVEVQSEVEKNIVAVCHDDGNISIWDLREREKAVGMLPAGILRATMAKFLPNYSLISGGPSGSLCLWDLRAMRLEDELGGRPPAEARDEPAEHGKRKRDAKARPSPVRSLAVSPDGAIVGCGRANGAITVMRTDSRELLHDIIPHRGQTGSAVRALAFDALSRTLLSGGDDHHVCVFDARAYAGARAGGARAQHESFVAHNGWVTSVSASPDPAERAVVTTSWDATVKIWDYSERSLLHTYKEHADGVLDSAFAGGGEFFATCGADAALALYVARSLASDGAEEAKEELDKSLVPLKDGVA